MLDVIIAKQLVASDPYPWYFEVYDSRRYARHPSVYFDGWFCTPAEAEAAAVAWLTEQSMESAAL